MTCESESHLETGRGCVRNSAGGVWGAKQRRVGNRQRSCPDPVGACRELKDGSSTTVKYKYPFLPCVGMLWALAAKVLAGGTHASPSVSDSSLIRLAGLTRVPYSLSS